MKKILFAISALFVLAACSHDNIEQVPMPGEGTTVVNFSVQLPEMQEATRSFTKHGIERLHLLVFDENGYFVEAKAAAPTTPTSFGVASGTTYGFSVELSQSPSKRTIHFVANSPTTDVKNYPFGSERELINALSTSGAQDAYWQRVELPDGIIKGQTAGSLVGTSLANLTAVPLVRNFVKITGQNKVADDANGGFVLEGIALVNTPNQGTIAPYNVNRGNYAVYHSSTTYSGLNSAGYYGFEPADMAIDTTIPIPTTFVAAQDATDDEETVAHYAESYMYERRMHDMPSDYTYVIIKGKYNNGTPSYYKVDIINKAQNGAYFDLLRNFNYVIDINAVLGDGFGSAEDAAAAVASNNISASIDTQNLLNISDGKARLYVEYVDKVLTKAGTYTLKYKYVPNIKNQNTVDNDYVTTGSPTTTNPVDLSMVVEGNVIKTGTVSVANADVDGWRTITFETKDVDGVKNQTITIRAGALKRDIKLSLRDPFQMSVAVTGTGTALGSARTVTISLPTDLLPEAIFPLEFVIVDKNLSISPDTSKDNNNLPVKTGINADGVAVANGQYFGFVKKLEYEEYVTRDTNGNITDHLPKLSCYFITNKSNATPSVKVYNEYFTTAPN